MSSGGLRCAVSIFLVLIGSLMLVAPHQFASPTFTSLQPMLQVWGLGFLGAGSLLLATGVLAAPRLLDAAAFALAGALLLVLMYGFAAYGALTGVAVFAVLGLGTMAAPLLARSPGQPHAPRRDLLVLVLGSMALLVGGVLLGWPDQFTTPVYDGARPYLTAHGAVFVLGGLGLVLVHLLAPPRALVVPTHLFAAAAFLSFFMTAALPGRIWTGIVIYGGGGVALALLPWLGPRLRRLDICSLRARLALVLAAAAGFPLVIAVTLVADQDERSATEVALSGQENLAVAVAGHVAENYLLRQVVGGQSPARAESTLDPGQLIDVFARQARARGERISLIDRERRVIAHPDPSFLLRPAADTFAPELMRGLDAGVGSGAQTVGLGPAQQLVGHASVSQLTWIVITERPAAMALARTHAARDLAYQVLLLAIVAAAVLGALASRWLVAPLRTLARAASAFASGDTTAPLPTSTITEVAQVASAFGATRAQLALQTERTARLQELASALGGTLATEEVVEIVGGGAIRTLGAVSVAVALVTDDGSGLRLLRRLGTTAHALRLDAPSPIPLEERRPMTDVVRSGGTLVYTSVAELKAAYPLIADEFGASGLKAAVVLALRVDERRIGGIAVSFDRPRTFDADELAFLRALADVCAQALDRAHLYEAEQHARLRAEAAARQLETLQAVIDAGLAARGREDLLARVSGRLRAVLAADTASVLLGVEDEDSLAGRVSATRQPLVVDDVARSPWRDGHAHLTSMVGVPLLVDGRVLGVLHVGSERARSFTGDDVRFLQLVGDRVAQALDQARADEALRQAHERALTAIRERDEFLSVAAHELKTPITSLQGAAQLARARLARDGTPDPAQIERTLAVVNRQAGRLTQLVNQLLDVARIEAGKLVLNPEPTDLRQLLNDVVPLAPTTAAAHPIEIRTPPEPVLMVVDPLRIEQVLLNLLTNAIKYSPDGGRIEVALERAEPTAVRLCVRDRGMGIPPGRREHIFERFYQAHAEGHLSGLGLGLYVSRQIVELHGGTIAAEFPADGGTRFVVTLPVDERS